MAFPTSVNAQITDVLNTSPDGGADTITEHILATSNAFTKTLEMENRVFQEQLNGITTMAVDIIQQLITLCKESVAIKIDNDGFGTQVQQMLTDLKQQASSTMQNINAAAGNTTAPALGATAPATEPADQNLDTVLISCVGQSYRNAVSAQQTTMIIAHSMAQAVSTMAITTLYSIGTAVVSVVVRDELKTPA
jgi:hypothetical protein